MTHFEIKEYEPGPNVQFEAIKDWKALGRYSAKADAVDAIRPHWTPDSRIVDRTGSGDRVDATAFE